MWVNKLPLTVVLFILTAIVSYLSVSFIHLSIDPAVWPEGARVAVVILIAFFWFVIGGVIHGE